MVVYFLFFFGIAVLAVNYEFNKEKGFYLLGAVAILLSLLAGLRHPSIGRDYMTYLYSFEVLYADTGTLKFAMYEPGYILIVYFIRSIFEQDYGIAIMLFYAFVSVILKVSAIRSLAINPYLVILFYFSNYFILHEMTQIRIGLASAIFFVSIGYYLKGNMKVFISLILIAFCFHYSAIIYLLILLLRKDSFNRYLYTGIIAASLILAFFPISFSAFLSNIEFNEVPDKIGNYAVTAEYAAQKINVLNVIIICNIICCLYLIVAVAPDGFAKDKKLAFFLKCNIISIFLLSFFSGIPYVAFRVSELFGVLSMFVFAYLARYLPFGRYNIFITLLIAGRFLLLFCIKQYIDKALPAGEYVNSCC